MSRFHVRCMIRRDMDEVLVADAATMGTWGLEAHLAALRLRNVIGMVVEDYNSAFQDVVGYMVYELHKSKLVLLRLAVNPNSNYALVAQLMLDTLAAKLVGHRRTSITFDVDERNDALLYTLKNSGFEATRVIRGGGSDGSSDSYRFRYYIPATANDQTELTEAEQAIKGDA